MTMFLQSTEDPNLKFEILSFDKKTTIARLKGKYSEFTEPLTKERMLKHGYKITKEEAHATD